MIEAITKFNVTCPYCGFCVVLSSRESAEEANERHTRTCEIITKATAKYTNLALAEAFLSGYIEGLKANVEE